MTIEHPVTLIEGGVVGFIVVVAGGDGAVVVAGGLVVGFGAVVVVVGRDVHGRDVAVVGRDVDVVAAGREVVAVDVDALEAAGTAAGSAEGDSAGMAGAGVEGVDAGVAAELATVDGAAIVGADVALQLVVARAVAARAAKSSCRNWRGVFVMGGLSVSGGDEPLSQVGFIVAIEADASRARHDREQMRPGRALEVERQLELVGDFRLDVFPGGDLAV